MATAKRVPTTREVTRTVTVTETGPDEVVLTLTMDEAKFLRSFVGNVGGHPDKTCRKYTDAMWHALTSIGVPPLNKDSDLWNPVAKLEPGNFGAVYLKPDPNDEVEDLL